jgi:hypothetical protein
MCPTDVRPDASRIEAAVPSLRIGVVRISDALGNRPDVNIAVVNVPAFRSRGRTLHGVPSVERPRTKFQVFTFVHPDGTEFPAAVFLALRSRRATSVLGRDYFVRQAAMPS